MDTSLSLNPSNQTQFRVHTFGCKVNTYDSGLIQSRVQKELGWKATPSDSAFSAQVHILNTCAVTAEASKEALRQARKIKSKNPFALVVATGCAAQVDSGLLVESSAIDLVVANSHKTSLPFLIDQFQKGSHSQKLFRSNIFRKADTEPGGGVELEHTRSFLKIQDGCNSFCSFCIIPYARGTSRSLSILDLVERIHHLESLSIKEVVLTGVHIGDYRDPVTGFGLEDLLEQILRRTKMPRIRLTSLEPKEISDRLLELFQNPRMMPHFHMSIQAANTDVLRAMKRQYGKKEVVNALEAIAKRVPHAFVGMDVIAGFPAESTDQFDDTFRALRSLPWSRLHVFPYSERSGTKALLLPPVPKDVRHHRAKHLRDLSTQRFSSLLFAQQGERKRGLVLKNSPGSLVEALSEDYFNLRILAPSDLLEESHTGFDQLDKMNSEGFWQFDYRSGMGVQTQIAKSFARVGEIQDFKVVAIDSENESLYVEPI